MKIGDIVYYKGHYDSCRKYKYEIFKIWKNQFGVDFWYDLKVVGLIQDVYQELLSVEKRDIQVSKKD
jgi:hypothetical protein